MKTVISCVIDHDPRFLAQARLLLLSLRAAGVDDADTTLVVHAPQDMAGGLEALRALGAVIQPYSPFGTDPASVYCNKLCQLQTPMLRAADRVLLLDADLLMLRDPRTLFDDTAIRAKIVDVANPPEAKWRALFAAADLDAPQTAHPDFAPEALTPAFNCNGGLYLIPRAQFAALAEAWPHWARFCLERPGLLTDHLHHADQLGFALAMEALGLPFRPLAPGDNLPTHMPAAAYAAIPPQPITALHYHGRVDSCGAPRPTGVDWIDGPLSDAMQRIRHLGPDNASGEDRQSGAVTLTAPPRSGTNPHDITQAKLSGALETSPHPALLRDLAALSRAQLGFFPQTIIRTIEYPWIAARMPQAEGLRVLDMGAGVSALPLWLARRGARVTTVDGHGLHRVPPARSDWNEWGFIDYASLDGRVRSHNCLMQDLQGAGPFDLIYSVSVIEHIPAEARRAVLAAMRDHLVPGGRLLLTLDLIPGTDRLWDMSEGHKVDEGLPHGTIPDFMAELAALGFTVTEQVLFRAIADSRTELLMIDARLGDGGAA